jgi:hypothetical protein
MLKRLYLLLSTLWAIAFLLNGSTKLTGIGTGDLILALAPLTIGWAVGRAALFVTTGSFRRPALRVYKP